VPWKVQYPLNLLVDVYQKERARLNDALRSQNKADATSRYITSADKQALPEIRRPSRSNTAHGVLMESSHDSSDDPLSYMVWLELR
jgi:hypothetical protein